MSNTLENQKLDIANAKRVYETLSAIDVTPFLEKINGCDYLSWAKAWSIIMERFPLAHYTFGPEKTFADGTVEVSVEVTIHGMTRSMFLPVMTGYQHKAKANPNAREIGDTKVRCLVKCLAMFGLGLYVYQGEGFPEKEEKPGKSGSQKQSSPAEAKGSVPTTTNSSAKPSGSSRGNSLDEKLASVKQLDAIERGEKVLVEATNSTPEKMRTLVLNYINKRRKDEDQPAVDRIQQLRYFDAERVIKYLAPKVKKAKVALAEAVGENQ